MSAISNIPLIGFGTFIAIEEKKAETEEKRQSITEKTVFNALKAGYRHFDCANAYNNEVWVGNAFRQAFLPVEEGGLGLSREELWITTKGAAKNLDQSLENLGIDYSDLHIEHFPLCFSTKKDLVAEWKLMNEHIQTGKTKRIGVSNHYQPHIERLLSICEEYDLQKPYANQIEIHPRLQENEFISFCQELGIRLIAYSPLGYANRQFTLQDELIMDITKKTDLSAAQVVLAWNIKRGVCVIPKSSHPNRMSENLQSIDLIDKLAQEDMDRIKTLDFNMHLTITSEEYKNGANSINWS